MLFLSDERPKPPPRRDPESALNAYDKRVKRIGIVNMWDSEEFSDAVRASGKKQLIVGCVTTDFALCCRR